MSAKACCMGKTSIDNYEKIQCAELYAHCFYIDRVGGIDMPIVKLVRSIGFVLLVIGLVYVFAVDTDDYLYLFGLVLGVVFVLDGVIAFNERKKRSLALMYFVLALFMIVLSISLFIRM